MMNSYVFFHVNSLLTSSSSSILSLKSRVGRLLIIEIGRDTTQKEKKIKNSETEMPYTANNLKVKTL